MNRLLPFADFSNTSESTFTRPEIYFNKDSQCLRVGEQLIFLNENVIMDINDERVNEFLGIDVLSTLKKMIPDSPSEWVHLGVDGVAALCSAGAFVTFGISEAVAKWIELIHGISYFIEAKYKPEEKMRLWISGFITLAFSNIPLIGGVGAMVLKSIGKVAKFAIGGFFKMLFGFGIPGAGLKLFVKMIAKSAILMGAVGKTLANLTKGTLGKLMMKLPIMSSVMKFFRNDLDLALEKTGSHLTTDLAVYTHSVIANSEQAIAKTYGALSKEARQIITQKQFVEMNKGLIHKEMTGLPMSTGLAKLTPTEIDVARNFLARSGGVTGREAVQKAAAANVSVINQSIAKVNAEVAQVVEQGIAKDASMRGIQKSIIENATKKGVAEDLIKHIKTTGGSDGMSVVMRKFSMGSKTIGQRILIFLKQGLKTAAKDTIDNTNSPTDLSMPSMGNFGSSSNAGSTSGTSGAAMTMDGSPSSASNNTTDTNTRVEGDAKKAANRVQLSKAFIEQNHLTMAEAADKKAMGEFNIIFHTPHKDNTDGKLILSGAIFDGEQDVTSTLHSYEDRKNLLADLKVAKGKEDKTTVRDGEYKKWERSNTFTTPYVNEDTGRYVFHFLVRDRSIISLAKKNAEEKLIWSEVLTPEVLEKGYFKINSSIYILVKKVTDKGYDE